MSMDFIAAKKNMPINFNLDVIERLMQELSNPEKDLKVIHLAGTNGKGSVSTYMEYILNESNYRVGKYSSPYVFDFREQIRVDCENISQEDLDFELSIIDEVCIKLQKENIYPSEFETMTALAFNYFKRKNVDFVIIEAGLGGKNDATNVVSPILSVFTSVSMDHIGMIGENLIEIAEEKSGIIKSKVPVLSYFQKKEVLEVLQNKAKELNCDFYSLQREGVEILELNMGYSEFSFLDDVYRINILGKHQIYNAALAMKGIEILNEKYNDLNVSKEEMKNGVSKAELQGRFDVISEEPVIVLDGAHNKDAAIKLRESILTYFEGKKRTAIFAVMKDKDVRSILREVHDLFDEFIIHEPNVERSMPTFDISNILVAVKYRGKIKSTKNVQETVESIKENNEDRVYVAFGSFKDLELIKDVIE